ncbi:MAG TPA: PQQ-dependent sugar dehydrogenase, partial [Candidatus Sulfomarinibacteraceae bacterium]|nr:PQQ-dependent sugar dehydrogenase [Candidatus Sulfomarinibacteraceae bacterium]
MRKFLFLATLFLALAFAAALAGTSGVAHADHGSSPIGDPFTARVNLVADGFTSPVHLTEAPDGSGRLFVVDQAGLIHIIGPDGQLLADPFLDVRDRMVSLNPGFDERGLLGLAFHPDYASNGRFFVYYSVPLREGAPAGFNHTSRISEFHVSADPDHADPASERILLQVDQPQGNHNAGALAFGPADGYLYIALGDGGGANDNQLGHVEDWYAFNGGGNGQDVEQNLLGSILRIDVDDGDPYGIPGDNPFVGRDGLDEIYAYGLRNPYRISFDMGGNHALFAGDAGQGLWEEVSVIENGGNYGWNVKEGTHCFDAENNTVIPPDCPDFVGEGHPDTGAPLIDPVIEYANAAQPGGIGRTVVGGYVYRGDDLPQFRGRYIFADWSTNFFPGDGTVLVSRERPQGLWQIHEIQFQNRPDGRLGHFIL